MSKRHTPKSDVHLSTPADRIFQPGADVEAFEIEAERELIAAAQRGDSAAATALLEAYAPALRSGVSGFTRTIAQTPIPVDVDDLHQAAMLALYEQILAFDLEKPGRLARVVKATVRRALADEQAAAAMIPVPTITLRRFLGALRSAGGNVSTARTIAAEHDLRPETFDRVLDAVRNTISLEGYTTIREAEIDEIEATSIFADEPISEDVYLLADRALGAMDARQTEVVRMSYGFDEADPLPDAEIAHRLGSSRPTVQRVRARALDVAREALGVTEA